MRIDVKPSLKVEIAKKGFTRREIADKAEITYMYLHYILSGKSHPSITVCKKIYEVLGLQFDDLFYIKEV